MRKSTLFGILASTFIFPGLLVDIAFAQVPPGGTGSDISGGSLSDISGFNVFSESPLWNEITGSEIPQPPICGSCNLRRFGIGKPRNLISEPRRFTLKFAPNRSCPVPKSCNQEELDVKYLRDLTELERKAETVINNRLW
ncbi:MAG: hypothetical protein AAFQ91_01885 [Cyanobacteria bacterium J06621_15]